MSANGKKILEVAANEIGYREGKNRDNKYGKWFGMNHVAWCVEFAGWVYCQAGIRGPILGLTRSEGGTASCGELLRWYQRHQPECIAKEPIPGCAVIFDFPKTAYDTDHIGLFVSMDKNSITTIDGNTSGGTANDANGGCVRQRTRPLSYANPIFIVPKELNEMIDWNEAIKSLTDEQAIALDERIQLAKSKLPASEYAEGSCRKAITSGLFKDGDGDGMLDRPRCGMTREEFAVVLDRRGELEVKK